MQWRWRHCIISTKIMNKLLILIGIVSLFGCNIASPKKEILFPIEINIEDAIKKEYALSDFVDSIEYIYLTEQMSGPIMKYDISDNYAVFYDGMNRILLFRRDGNYVRQIGRSGKGPGEYVYIRDLILDEQDNTIYALCETDHIYKYDLEGTFLTKIPTEPDTDLLGLVSPGVFVTHIANWSGDKNDRYIVRNGAGEIIKKYNNPFLYSLKERHQWTKEAVKCTFDNQLHVKDKGDTLFTITENRITPRYIIKNKRSINRSELTQEIYDDSFEYSYILETDKGLFFSFFKWTGKIRERESYFYNKEKKQLYEYKKKRMEYYEGIANDLDDKYEYVNWTQHNNVLMTFRLDFDDEELAGVASQIRNKIKRFRNRIDDEDPIFMVIMHLK